MTVTAKMTPKWRTKNGNSLRTNVIQSILPICYFWFPFFCFVLAMNDFWRVLNVTWFCTLQESSSRIHSKWYRFEWWHNLLAVKLFTSKSSKSLREYFSYCSNSLIYVWFKNSSLWSSVKEIFSQDGLFGFFSGLIPKLLCDLTCIALTSTTCYLVNKYYISEQGNRTYFAGFVQFVYASVLYPIQVVSTCMVVTGSR